MKVRKDFGDLSADGRIEPSRKATVYNSLYCIEQEFWSGGGGGEAGEG